MKTYIIVWHHKYGVDTALVKSGHYPSPEEIAEILDWEYEPDKGESMEIEVVDLDKIVEIKSWHQHRFSLR